MKQEKYQAVISWGASLMPIKFIDSSGFSNDKNIIEYKKELIEILSDSSSLFHEDIQAVFAFAAARERRLSTSLAA